MWKTYHNWNQNKKQSRAQFSILLFIYDSNSSIVRNLSYASNKCICVELEMVCIVLFYKEHWVFIDGKQKYVASIPKGLCIPKKIQFRDLKQEVCNALQACNMKTLYWRWL